MEDFWFKSPLGETQSALTIP